MAINFRPNQIEKWYRKKLLPRLEVVENLFEFALFMWRWVLAAPYAGLAFCLALLAIKATASAWALHEEFFRLEESMAIVKILGIVDMVLVLNLILMVLFVGYVNFVSKIKLDNEDDRPSWMDSLDYSGLKIQLLGSIVAISSVQMLRQYMDLEQSVHPDYEKLRWMIVFHATFVLSILIFSAVNYLHQKPARDESEDEEAGESGEESDDEDSEDMLPILVAAVYPGKKHQIVLNRGRLNAVRPEELRIGRRMVVSSTGESITDPTTGDMIGWQEDIIGEVEIIRVLEKTSIAEPVRKLTAKITVGDAVRPMSE